MVSWLWLYIRYIPGKYQTRRRYFEYGHTKTLEGVSAMAGPCFWADLGTIIFPTDWSHWLRLCCQICDLANNFELCKLRTKNWVSGLCPATRRRETTSDPTPGQLPSRKEVRDQVHSGPHNPGPPQFSIRAPVWSKYLLFLSFSPELPFPGAPNWLQNEAVHDWRGPQGQPPGGRPLAGTGAAATGSVGATSPCTQQVTIDDRRQSTNRLQRHPRPIHNHIT